MGRKMQRARVFLRIEAWGGGVQRHSSWKADGGGGRAEGSHQTSWGEARRKQWGVEGPSSKQGKRRSLYVSHSSLPPPSFQKIHLQSKLLSLITWSGGRRSWRRTSRWRRTACWSTSRSAWACGGRCRTTSSRPGTSSHCQLLATRLTLSGPGVPDVHLRFQFLVQLSNFRWFNQHQIVKLSSLIAVTTKQHLMFRLHTTLKKG